GGEEAAAARRRRRCDLVGEGEGRAGADVRGERERADAGVAVLAHHLAGGVEQGEDELIVGERRDSVDVDEDVEVRHLEEERAVGAAGELRLREDGPDERADGGADGGGAAGRLPRTGLSSPLRGEQRGRRRGHLDDHRRSRRRLEYLWARSGRRTQARLL